MKDRDEIGREGGPDTEEPVIERPGETTSSDPTRTEPGSMETIPMERPGV